LRREDTVTTNETERTGERPPADDVFPSEEPTEGRPETDDIDMTDVDDGDDESRRSVESEPLPSEDPEVAARRAAEDDTVADGVPPNAEVPAAEPASVAPSSAGPSLGGQQPEAELASADTASDLSSGADTPLLTDATGYQDRWYEIQTGFVDEPARAVQNAGELLTEVMDDLTRRLTAELEALDTRQGGGEASTEDLRVTFQRYRTFFDRLLTT
jgi:hypothetical protein